MFSANSGSGSNAYHAVGVESMASTGGPHQLVLMLFNGARAAIAVAKGHMARREIPEKGMAISKAIEIIEGGRKASLDMNVGGELAQNLSDLCVYIGQRQFQANVKNDTAALDEVATLLQQLGDAWSSIAGAKPAKAPAAHASTAARTAPEVRPAAAPGAANRAPAAAPTPMYGAGPAPTRPNPGSIAPAPTPAETPAPAQTHRPAAALAQAYGAAARTQAESVPVSSPSASAIAPATSGPAIPPDSAGTAAPSSQSRRLAAAYGVR